MAIAVRSPALEDAAAIAHIHVDTWQDAYPGLLPQSLLKGFTFERQHERWIQSLSDPAKIKNVIVGEVDDVIGGFIIADAARDRIEGHESEILAINISPRYQRTGLGTALFAAALRSLTARGFSNAYLWVLDGNVRGLRFYEKHGGVRLPHTKETEGALEVCYGWRDIARHPLLRQPGR